MKTDVVKPNDVFYHPTQLVVPLFQRPYVWSKETQWAPLWEDVVRLIEVIQHHNQDATHFLGAIVIQQVPTPLGSLPMWNVIDGQQRLTTLQILLDALHRQLLLRGLDQLAGQIFPLIANPSDYRASPEDRYKLWPTNRDRESFVAVMSAAESPAYDDFPRARLVKAHHFFSVAISEWLGDAASAAARARMLVPAILNRLEIASIRLDANEDAQAIFETLNARGTPLSAADLIKNFVFQNLDAPPAEAEKSYLNYWAEFETPWWEETVTTGRITNSRSSLFLWQWLTARTLSEFPIREVFSQFKYYVNTVEKDIPVLLRSIKEAADRYRAIIQGGEREHGPLQRAELFSYRIKTLDSEIARPLLIWLEEPEQSGIPPVDKTRILAVTESWLVRRALVKTPTQGANRFVIDTIRHLRDQPQDALPEALEAFLTSNRTPVGYWPDDSEVRNALHGARAFTKYRRGRLRMVLEALEDWKRGYPDGKRLSMGPIARSKGTIEHLMPRKWRKHWSQDLSEAEAILRDEIVHQLGNLTLVTKRLNSTISNGPWVKKRNYFLESDDVLITKEAINLAQDHWDEATIEKRTDHLIQQILTIWPVPVGHSSLTESAERQPIGVADVDVAQLVASGWITVGARLRSRHRTPRWENTAAVVSQDGRIYIGDTAYETPTGAATAVRGKQTNGWWWWVVEDTGRSLRDIRAEYLAGLGEADGDDEAMVDSILLDPELDGVE